MGILSLIGLIVVVLWLAGLLVHIGGNLIYALLVIGIILFILDVLRGRGNAPLL